MQTTTAGKATVMKNKILFVVSLLFGLLFINAGLNKFFNYMPVPKLLAINIWVIVENRANYLPMIK